MPPQSLKVKHEGRLKSGRVYYRYCQWWWWLVFKGNKIKDMGILLVYKSLNSGTESAWRLGVKNSGF